MSNESMDMHRMKSSLLLQLILPDEEGNDAPTVWMVREVVLILLNRVIDYNAKDIEQDD